MLRHKGIYAFAVSLLALAVIGCDTSYDVLPVKGTITYDGEPVPELLIQFAPEGGRASTGSVKADGTFELGYTIDQMGVEPGKHTITVVHESPTDEAGEVPELTQKALDDFETNGPIEATIDSPQENFEIKLPR